MSARDSALYELDQRLLPGWEPDLLPLPTHRPPNDPRDLSLSEQITMGVIQNHLHLIWLIENYSGRKLTDIDPLVLKILSIGMYQLRFLDRVPESAAVNEAVEQAKRFGRTKAAGFVNAVLRKVTRQGPPPSPNRQTQPADYAERMLSHPRELFARFIKLMGPIDALRLCEHNNRQPPTIIRLFPGVEVAQLKSPEITLTPHDRAGMYVVEPAKRATLFNWAQQQWAQVQDPTASAVVEKLQLAPGQRVLDRCAGLGTKTFQLRDQLDQTGRIVAMDPAGDRIAALRALCVSRGFPNIDVYQAGILKMVPALAKARFDRALVDVPCSNSGVLARRPEARYAQTADAMSSLDRLQRLILDDTATAVAHSGLLLYSTCSIWPEENEQQVARFLKRHLDFKLLNDHTTLPNLDPIPTRYHDGGYFALLQRAG